MIDLRECKGGETLISTHGTKLTYICQLPEDNFYDHLVKYPDGSEGSRIHDGHVYRNASRRMDVDEDIVEIVKEKK